MGCCIGALLLAGAPRIALLVWWIAQPVRVLSSFAAFSQIGGLGLPPLAWALVGLIFVPWLTIAYVFLAPGGIVGIEWGVLLIALVIDLITHGGGGRAYDRRRSLA